jgi:hypothetical protein
MLTVFNLSSLEPKLDRKKKTSHIREYNPNFYRSSAKKLSIQNTKDHLADKRVFILSRSLLVAHKIILDTHFKDVIIGF